MSFLELWDDLHYKGRWTSFRRFLCREGLHWPITFWDTRGGSYGPPEANWACETCGHERLPYRASFWWPLVDALRRPVARWRDRRQIDGAESEKSALEQWAESFDA